MRGVEKQLEIVGPEAVRRRILFCALPAARNSREENARHRREMEIAVISLHVCLEESRHRRQKAAETAGREIASHDRGIC